MPMNAARAMLCCALLLVAPAAQAADKVIAGSLGGQAPLWAIYVAVHKGFFAAEGLDLELNFAQSGAAVTQQLTAGSLDVALSVGITDPIRAIDKGASLALIRVIGNSPPYVLIGKPSLKSITDLKGKTISVGADNDITTVYFERMMAANGLKKGDYDTIPAGVAAARFAALKAGVVDAAIVLPPLNFQATAAGFVTLGLAADYVKDVPFTGMAVHRRWAAANLSAAKRILAATDKSIASAGAKVTVTGWGALWSPYDKDVASLMPDLGEGKEMTDKINFPLKLREVEIEAMDNDTCNSAFAGDKLSVAETEICAMYQGTTKASCQGDSGGPLVVATPGTPRGFTQVGVVSWGTICGNTVTPSVFARVSSFNDWINDTMKNN